MLMAMDGQKILLAMVGATVSLMLAMVLIWYSKSTITKTLSRHQVLHRLRVHGMSQEELANDAKHSSVISARSIPGLIQKLETEGFVQRTAGNRYVITTQGIEALKNLESASGQVQKVAKIVSKTSMISKVLVNEAIDRIVGMKDFQFKMDSDNSQVEREHDEVPEYSAKKQSPHFVSEEVSN